MTRRLLAAPLAALLCLAGCLPSSQKELDRTISAADSASAALAATVAVDTLTRAWTSVAPDADPMQLPSTLAWMGDTLAVVETGDGSVRRFTASGAYLDATPLPTDGFPYLAGVRGDTLVVLARGPGELWWVRPGQGVVRRVRAPAGATAAFAAPGRLAVRVGGGPSDEDQEPQAPMVLGLSEDGRVVSRTPLPGPAWRSVGFLRDWDGQTVALSGYRPVLDLVPSAAASGAPADTLALVGFDSPQFARSAQFQRRDVTEPPLLASSAAALGNLLFVLNLRDDHVRIDVYGRDGRLQRVLVSPRPWAPVQPVALDLAVRQRGGTVEIAVLRAMPPGLLRGGVGEVALYRWRPSPAVAGREPTRRDRPPAAQM